MAHAGGRPKGHPKSGGRKRGSKNLTPGRHVVGTAPLKRELTTLMALDLPPIKLEDMHPLVVIHAIMVMRFSSGDFAGALYAAVALAPYTNAKLTSSEVHVTHTLATMSDDELQAQALAYERRLAAANGEATIDGEVVH
jgi:hypothetical protein